MFYSNEIIKLNSGLFMVKNYKNNRNLFSYLMLLGSIFFLVMAVLLIKEIKEEENYVPIFFHVCAFIGLVYSANDVKKIIFNIKEQKIIFKYGLFLKKVKVININELKEVSINSAPEEINRGKRIIGKKYNVDLVHKNLNAYRIYQSVEYADELKDFAKKISEIINVELIDKNSVDGYRNIFNKIIM